MTSVMASEERQYAVHACVFDAYGTLFDIASAVWWHGEALEGKADAVAHTWRAKQLEHAWAGTLRGAYVDFCQLDGLLDACISIEDVGVYKPAPQAYALAAWRLGLDPRLIGFVSSNPWDVAGALGFGFLPVWVNRDGRPDEYSVRSVVHQAATLTAAAGRFQLAPKLGPSS